MKTKLKVGDNFRIVADGLILITSLSHNDQIRSYLESGKTLTAMDALNNFGCWNLKGRIHELRQSGMNIKTDMITTATGKRIGKYSLIKE